MNAEKRMQQMKQLMFMSKDEETNREKYGITTERNNTGQVDGTEKMPK